MTAQALALSILQAIFEGRITKDAAVKTSDALDISIHFGTNTVFLVDHEHCNDADCCLEAE